MNNTKDVIREQALVLFGKNGYEGVSVNQIAKLSGIKKGTFYGHYESKQALFLTILTQEFSKFLNLMFNFISTLNDIPTMDKLFFIFKRCIEYYSENSDTTRFLMRFTYFPSEDIKEVMDNGSELNNLQEIMRGKLLELFQEGISRGEISPSRDINELVRSYFWMCTTTGINILYYNTGKNLEQIELAWDMYLNGIRNK